MSAFLKPSRRVIIVTMSLISLGLWLLIVYLPQLEALRYPLNQFYVFCHEAGHAVAALLTGGEVYELAIFGGLGGHVVSQGGNFAIISPAGYIGAALIGSLLFWLTNTLPKWCDVVAYFIGSFTLLVTAIFASSEPVARMGNVALVLPIIISAYFVKNRRFTYIAVMLVIVIGGTFWLSNVRSSSGVNIATLVGLVLGCALLIFATTGKPFLALPLLNVFNFSLVFNIVVRTRQLVGTTMPASHDDAAQYAAAFGGNPTIVAAAWFAGCIFLIACSFFLVWKTVGKPTE